VTRRLLLDTVIALLVAFVLAAVGAWAVVPLIPLFVSWLGVDQLIVTRPTEVPWFQAKHGLALALPAVLAWLVALAHRLRTKTAPREPTLALYFAVPLLAVAFGMVLRFFGLRYVFDEMKASPLAASGLEPMVTVDNLSLAGWGARAGLVAAAILFAIVMVRSPKSPSP